MSEQVDGIRDALAGTDWSQRFELFLRSQFGKQDALLNCMSTDLGMVRKLAHQDVWQSRFQGLELVGDVKTKRHSQGDILNYYHGLGLTKVLQCNPDMVRGKRLLHANSFHATLPGLFLASVGAAAYFHATDQLTELLMAMNCVRNNLEVEIIRDLESVDYDVLLEGITLCFHTGPARAEFIQEQANRGKLVIVEGPMVWTKTNANNIDFDNKTLLFDGRVNGGWELFTFSVEPNNV